MQEINLTQQFIAAVNALIERGVSRTRLCDEAGIDRRNLERLLKTPSEHYPRPKWLTAICSVYGVNPSFLILGEGDIFRA